MFGADGPYPATAITALDTAHTHGMYLGTNMLIRKSKNRFCCVYITVPLNNFVMMQTVLIVWPQTCFV